MLVAAALLIVAAVALWVIREPSSPAKTSAVSPSPTATDIVAAEEIPSTAPTATVRSAAEKDFTARREALPALLEAGDFEAVVAEADAILEENDQLPLVHLLRGIAFRELEAWMRQRSILSGRSN